MNQIHTIDDYFPLLAGILCLEPSSPIHGIVAINSQPLGVGTTATYSCDPGYVLVGETIRTCEDANNGTTGSWSGSIPMCEGSSINYYTPFQIISGK